MVKAGSLILNKESNYVNDTAGFLKKNKLSNEQPTPGCHPETWI